MVPEKGRNAQTALDHALPSDRYDVAWIGRIINERGKRAAKTGVGFDNVQAHVDRLNWRHRDTELDEAAVYDPFQQSNNQTFRLGFKDFGRLELRPVFEHVQLPEKRVEGYESPVDAIRADAETFYAAYDTVAEELLREGTGLDLGDGLRSVVIDRLDERGYELAEELGDAVKWAVMCGGEAVPESPSVVLVPEAYRHLGEALAVVAWDDTVTTKTYEEYAVGQGIDFTDEEALLASAPADVAGVYMFVSGGTAREYGLTVQRIEGAVSRLGVFQKTDTSTTMEDLNSLKGMYDRYPGEFSSWRTIIDTVEETASEFGFREINTPSVEKTDLYRQKSGDELMDQTYTFEDKAGREVTLTPEQTPTRARLVQKRKDLTKPIKWFDTSKRWRYENVQKGRDREFFQTDIDIFGVESVSADAEVIACGARIYQKLGVEERVDFLVNDRRLLESVLSANGISNTQEVMGVIDDKEKMTDAEFREALLDRGITEAEAENVDDVTELSGPIDEVVTDLRDIAPEDENTTAAIDRMQRLADQLDAHGVAEMCQLDLSIVRGLAYYTGLVFEAFDTEGELRALFGGGRYDELVGQFGEQDVPAVGFAFGYSTTRELLKREGKWPEEEISTDVYVAPVSESVQPTAVGIANDIRAEGKTVDIDLSGRSIGSQFSYADTINAAFTIVVGERDLEDGEVTIQNMASGEEENVPLEDVTEELLARHGE